MHRAIDTASRTPETPPCLMAKKLRFSPSEVARNLGISRSTLYRHVAKGKVSSLKDERGKTYFALSEVERAYGKWETWNRNTATPDGKPDGTDETARVSALEMEVSLLKTQLEEARQRENQYIDREANLWEQIHQANRLLEARSSTGETPSVEREKAPANSKGLRALFSRR